MLSNKKNKWSSSVSLSKLVSRISRTISFASKKSQHSSKRTNKVEPKNQSALTNTFFVPKSVPIIRRQLTQPISEVPIDEFIRSRYYVEGIMKIHFNDKNEIEEDNYDDSRNSLQPNLSLFNISFDNTCDQREDNYQQYHQQTYWLDHVLHSTKIDY